MNVHPPQHRGFWYLLIGFDTSPNVSWKDRHSNHRHKTGDFWYSSSNSDSVNPNNGKLDHPSLINTQLSVHSSDIIELLSSSFLECVCKPPVESFSFSERGRVLTVSEQRLHAILWLLRVWEPGSPRRSAQLCSMNQRCQWANHLRCLLHFNAGIDSEHVDTCAVYPGNCWLGDRTEAWSCGWKKWWSHWQLYPINPIVFPSPNIKQPQCMVNKWKDIP